MEDQGGAGLLAELAVAVKVARVALEVLGGAKLRGVHKVGDHDAVVLGGGADDEALVALVEVAHGGDEANGQALAAPLAHLLADLGDGGNCLHDMFLL